MWDVLVIMYTKIRSSKWNLTEIGGKHNDKENQGYDSRQCISEDLKSQWAIL